MADLLTRDLLKAGEFVGQAGYIAGIENVNGSGTIALTTTTFGGADYDYLGLPSKKDYKTKRVYSTYTITEENGSEEIVKKLIGYEVKTTFNQRDAATYEFDTLFDGRDCVLLLAGHFYDRMAVPINRGWLAVFGQVVLHEDEIDSKNGEVPFFFKGKINNRAIVWETTPTTGLAYPSITGVSSPAGVPNGDITIAERGIYKVIDIAD